MKKFLNTIYFSFITVILLYSDAYSNVIQDLNKFQTAFKLIMRNHISSPSSDTVVSDAITGMLKGLNDIHSTYMPAQDKEKFQESIKAHFGGIGIMIGSYTNDTGTKYLQILDLLKFRNCPAEIAGLKPKDLILKIDNINAADMDFEEAKEYLRGPIGSEVNLTVKRMNKKYLNNSDSDILSIKVIRDRIEIPRVYSKIVSDSIGYIRLVSYSEVSANQVKESLLELIDSNVHSIILDLRSNPGGLLTSAVEIVSLFIKDQKLVVYTKDKNNKITSQYYTQNNSICSLPLVLLVNEYSASASEITAGALKAYKRAFLIGHKTYGKGSVQKIFNLPDGSGIKITIAKYYTPDEVCIDNIGIEPDYYADINFKDKEDGQLEAAINFLNANQILK